MTVDDEEPLVGMHESVALALCGMAGIDPDTVGTTDDPVIVRVVGPGADDAPIRVAVERSAAGRLYTRTVES